MKFNITAFLAATAICAAAHAQSSSNRYSNRGMHDNQRSYNSQNQNLKKDYRTSQRNMQNQRSSPQLDWQRTVVVGYDLNNDGRVDAYYSTSVYDLERIRKQSDQRRSQAMQGNRNDQMRRSMQDSRQVTSSRSAQNISGTVKSIWKLNIAGLDKSRTIAGIKTDQGRNVAVILGSSDQVGDISKGDQIRVRAAEGMLNQRKVFVADRISSNGRTIVVNNKSHQGFKKIDGRIQETRKVELTSNSGQTKNLLVATVKTSDGQTRTVALGPADKRDMSRWEEGTKVSILAKPVRMNGRAMYNAHQVRMNDQLYNINTASMLRRSQESNRSR